MVTLDREGGDRPEEAPVRTSTSQGASVSTHTVASVEPTWRSRGPRIRFRDMFPFYPLMVASKQGQAGHHRDEEHYEDQAHDVEDRAGADHLGYRDHA